MGKKQDCADAGFLLAEMGKQLDGRSLESLLESFLQGSDEG